MKNIKRISLKKVRIIFYCLCLLGTLMVLLGAYISQLILIIFGGLGLFGTVIFFLVSYRCPCCGAFIGGGIMGEYCSHCGYPLDF